MDFFHEEDNKNGKLYDRKVYSMLFKYVWKYKKYLFIALAVIILITGIRLINPAITRYVIDRYITKIGNIVNISNLSTDIKSEELEKALNEGIELNNEQYYLNNSDLKYISKSQKDILRAQGVLSENDFLLMEYEDLSDELLSKLVLFETNGYLIRYKNNKVLVYKDFLSKFKVNELYQLRAMDFKFIMIYTCVMIFLLILEFGLGYLQIVMLMKLSQYSMRDLRKDLFDHIVSLEVNYFDSNPIGKLVNRVTNDIETLNEMFSNVFVNLFQEFLMMFGIIIIMFLIDPYLALVICTVIPLIVVLTMIFRVQVRKAYRKIRTRQAIMNSYLNESISGIRIIQIFVQSGKAIKKFISYNRKLYKAMMKQLYVYAVFRPVISLLRWISIGAVIYFGAKGILSDRITYGIVVMFVAYVQLFFKPVQEFSERFNILQSATAAGEKLMSIFTADAYKEVDSLYHSKEYEKKYLKSTGYDVDKLFRFDGEIEFDNVWFQYNIDQWILKGISFDIKPKQTLAIVGETGAGKSTIINILSKFYRIQKGRISIDGRDISDIPFDVLRKNISIVMQDVFLFSKSIKENITLGNKYDKDYFDFVTKVTHVDKFIDRLPNKENELVMERGETFSAGERQLLSFARALYFDPSILILDEATSSIDTETEKLIQDAIDHLIEDRTSIVIAHRLSTIKNADKIIVLEHGKIAEVGNHEELLAKKGMYYNLYRLQFSQQDM